AASIQRSIAEIDGRIYTAKSAAANKAILPDDRTDALDDVATQERLLETEKRDLQTLQDNMPKRQISPGIPRLSSQFGSQTPGGGASLFPTATQSPANAAAAAAPVASTSTKVPVYDPATGTIR